MSSPTSDGARVSGNPFGKGSASIGPAGPARRGTPMTLPPPGPVWFGSVMGIGATASMVQLVWQQRLVALVLLGVCWAVLLALVVGFAVRCLRGREVFAASVRPVDEVPMWGAVAMALLTTGSATSTVVPVWWPGWAASAWRVDLVLWLMGTAVGVVSTVAFTLRLMGRDCGRPAMVWGLAVVAPMVSATSGALLVPHVPTGSAFWLLAASAACFCVALVLGWAVFAGACRHAWRVEPVPLAASCTVWIPVALVGQSVAAIQAIAAQLVRIVLTPYRAQAHGVADAFGWVVVVCGTPFVAWAALVVARGVRRRMPFGPSWWSLTFPMGSMALGSHLFATTSGHGWLEAPAATWTAALCAAVAACATATITATARAVGRRTAVSRAGAARRAPR